MAKDNYTAIGHRIEELFSFLREKGIEMNNGLMADALDMDASQLSGVKTGKYSFTYLQIMKLNSIYDVRVGWLLEGELPVFKEKSGDQQPPDSHLLTLIEEHAKGILSNLKALQKAPPNVFERGKDEGHLPSQTLKLLDKKSKNKKPKDNEI